MRFGILGELAAWSSDDRVVPLPGTKVRTLLAALLIDAGRPVSADRLVDALWGDTPPNNPSGALHTKVWQLRRALEEGEPGASELLVAQVPGYRLDVTDLDAHRFERLLARARDSADPRARAAALGDALSAWRGPALADLADADFARAATARLEELRLTALEDRADAMLELGDHSLLVGELADLLVRHPLRERLHAAHMRALYGAGRQGEALAAFDALRVRLAEELGVEPGAELVALHGSVLRRDLALVPRPSPITTSARPVTNLPTPVSGLVGREAAVVQVRALLDAGRLVTLHGVGGVGKTRLAVEVASRVADDYPDGVWLVELSTADAGTDADVAAGGYSPVANLVAGVLGVRDEVASGAHGGRQAEQLADAVRTKQFLLVLDNCEHVVEQAARLSELLLRSAPGARVLATSQEPLGIGGERLWTVPPLTLPSPGGPGGPDDVAGSTAVQLFVARATEAAPGFALDPSTAAAVGAICRRLDGLPFALELAATRVRALGVREVAARLQDRFALLTVGSRGAPARHQTLRAAIDWSWELLAEQEQVVLRRLSAFNGGCSLQAAEEVCGGGPVRRDEVLDLVARLVDRSLVTTADVDGARRYRLLESVSAYSSERLREAGEQDEVRLRHAAHHADLAECALPHLRGPDQRRWLDRLTAEAGNFRAALDTADLPEATGPALRVVNALAWYWFLSGRLGEAKHAFATTLLRAGEAEAEAGGHASDRSEALAWQAGFSLRAGDSTYPLEQCDSLAEGIRDPLRRATTRWFLGFARIGFGDQDSAEKRIDRALGEFRALGDRWGTAAALAALATHSVLRGDLATTRQCGEEGARLFRELGDGWGLLQATDALASLAEMCGDYAETARLHRDGLRTAESLGLWNEVSTKLSGLGRTALLRGDYAQARELHGRAMRLAAEQGFTFGEQFAEVGLGLGARREGRLDAAQAHLRRWLDWCRQLDGGHGAALILAELGFVAELRGDAAGALALHREGFASAWATGDPRTIALAVEGVAGALALAGRHERAGLLLGAACAVRDAAGAPLPEVERGDVDRASARGAAALGGAFADVVERGKVLGLGEVPALLAED
ncbi:MULTISPECIES: BTAD domain-containing putative transcriptional regulator [Actinosynnema]|uniref:BTAD domain-containing putative transcriptional regulator n=1 Tax=Actinosynnema TaxID=40566 RepID=UPI0020A53CE8|nr:BTAD domain-containing putative transcriptional regulator [Actinosynnema pretiosum]MCP2094457.1 putative ATPase [Actinosynnema pretiosum]